MNFIDEATGDIVMTADKRGKFLPGQIHEIKVDSGVGVRKDEGKIRPELICPVAMEGLSAVLAFGAKKYADNNWAKGMKWSRVVGSLLRHTFRFMSGEDLDPESGLPHVDHIFTNAMFLSNYFRRQKAYDDRFKVDSDKA